MWREVARLSEIAPGGMLPVVAEGHEICLCECGGAFYAVSRACGHQCVPLDQGALLGWVLTCPLHHVRFDIRSGGSLSAPGHAHLGAEPLPEPAARFLRLERRLQEATPTHDLRTYAVRVMAESIEVDVPEPCTPDPSP